MSTSSDDDLPPLEDFSDHFKQPTKGGLLDGADNSMINIAPKLPQQTVTKTKPKPKPKNNNFGGFSSGFLSASNNKPKQKPKAKANGKKPETEQIIKPKKPQENTLKFDSVTNNMSNFLQKSQKDWLTDDLLDQVSGDKSLLSSLEDPETAKLLELMQKDPAAALKECNNNPAKMEMVRKFTSLLGNHMSKIEDKKVEKEKRVDQRDKILEKPKIKELIHYLKIHPERANHMIHSTKDEVFREDVRVLLASGDLKLDGSMGEAGTVKN